MAALIGVPNIRLDLLTDEELKQKYNELYDELTNLNVNNCTPEYKEGVERELNEVRYETTRRQ